MPVISLETKYVIEAGSLRYEVYHDGHGRLLIDNTEIWKNARFGVVFTDGKKIISGKKASVKETENAVIIKSVSKIGEVELEIKPVIDDERSRLEFRERVISYMPRKIREFILIDASFNGKGGTFLKNGWQSWSRVATLPLSDRAQPIPVIRSLRRVMYPSLKAKNRESSWVSAFHVNERELTVGAVGKLKYFTRIIPSPGRITVDCLGDGLSVPREGLESNTVAIFSGWISGLKAWASLQEIKKPSSSPPTGWCSWYYFYRNVREEDIIRNAEYAAKMKLPIEFIQLDDGYQKSMGDWTETKGSFPHGLEWLANKIHEFGFKAGIWVAPFLVSQNSSIFQQHPDWVIKHGKKRKPLKSFWNKYWREYGPVYHLDISNPDALNYVIDTLVKLTEMGYEYLKLDFLYAGISEGIRYDNEKTRLEIYRDAISSIRKALKGRAFLLGCGAPLEGVAGLFDAMRVSLDTSIHWNPSLVERFLGWAGHVDMICMKSAISQSLMRWYVSGFWHNDPDVLMIREPLNEEEMKTSVTGIALAGGLVFLSDDLSKLSAKRVDILHKAIPSLLPTAIPVDYTSRYPVLWKVFANGKPLIAAINWSDKTRTVSIPTSIVGLGSATAYEFWSGKVLGTLPRFDIKIPPHGSRVLVLSSPDDVFLGTNLHIAQPVNVSRNGNVVELSLSLPGERHGRMTLALPASAKIVSHDCKTCELEPGDLYRDLIVDFKNEAHIKIEL